jgi:NADH-quinone oxidoreductase subunit J
MMTMPFILAAVEQQTVSVALFYMLALITGGASLGVVISRNIVRTAVFLLFALLGVAGLYFMLNAEFLAAVQMVVYAGGTLILIIFGIMLTSKSPFSRFEPKLVEVVIAVSIGSVLLIALVLAITSTDFASNPLPAYELYPVDRLGQTLLGDYLVPFEVVSVVLLVVMIGAAYLAKGRRRENESPLTQNEAAMRRARGWS